MTRKHWLNPIDDLYLFITNGEFILAEFVLTKFELRLDAA
jgi:hypothetical protein